MRTGAKAYLATQVTTTTQGDLLLMLYDAAIKFLKQAKGKIVEKNYAEKGILISRALDIISELAESLNKEKGGDLAKNLHSLYFFCSARLAKANLKMDTGMVDEVIGILAGLRSAFAQIIPDYEGRPASSLHGAGEAAEPEPRPAPLGPQISHLDLMGSPAAALPNPVPQVEPEPIIRPPKPSAPPLRPAAPQAAPQPVGVSRLRAVNAYTANRG